MEQLVGGAAPIGDVGAERRGAGDAPVRLAERDHVPLHHPPLAGVGEHVALLVLRLRRSRRQVGEEFVAPGLALIRRHADLEPVLPGHLLAGVSGRAQDGVIAEVDVSLRIEEQGEEPGPLQHRAELAIRFPLPLVRPDARGDVEHGAADHPLAVHQHRALVDLEVHQLAVVPHHPQDEGISSVAVRPQERQVRRIDELQERIADHLLRDRPDQRGGARVQPDDPIARKHVQAREAVVEQQWKLVGKHRGPATIQRHWQAPAKRPPPTGGPARLTACAPSSATRTRCHFRRGTGSRCRNTGCSARA